MYVPPQVSSSAHILVCTHIMNPLARQTRAADGRRVLQRNGVNTLTTSIG